jgi:hypothetical protein
MQRYVGYQRQSGLDRWGKGCCQGTSMRNTEQLRSLKNGRLCRGKCKNKNPFCGNFSPTSRGGLTSLGRCKISFAGAEPRDHEPSVFAKFSLPPRGPTALCARNSQVQHPAFPLGRTSSGSKSQQNGGQSQEWFVIVAYRFCFAAALSAARHFS